MMRWNLNSMPLYAAAYLAVFVAAYPNGFRSTLGTQIDLLPPLVVYCALQSKWTTLAGITIFGGYLFDSLSANPLGLTTASLFISGCVIRVNRETILRDQTFAQLVIGFMASLATPVVSLLFLWLLGRPPLTGFGSIWQLVSTALLGALATPVLFGTFERIKRKLNFRPVPESSFRADREIKRRRA